MMNPISYPLSWICSAIGSEPQESSTPRRSEKRQPAQGRRKVASLSAPHIFKQALVLCLVGQARAVAAGGGVMALGGHPWGPEGRDGTGEPAARCRPGSRHLTSQLPTEVELELVLARHTEDLAWLDRVPQAWKVTVYDMAGASPEPRPLRNITLSDLPGGDASFAFAHHIVSRFDSLATYTAFAPASALDHSPNYLEILAHAGALLPVQPMSIRADADCPPPVFLATPDGDVWARPERISLRTLDSVFYRDFNHFLASSYQSYYHLPEGANLLKHFFAGVGLPLWMSEGQDIGSVAHAGMFGARRDKLMQHPRRVFEALKIKSVESPIVAGLIDRSWLMLLGGPGFKVNAMSPVRDHERGGRGRGDDAEIGASQMASMVESQS